jgi:hypothetical protein
MYWQIKSPGMNVDIVEKKSWVSDENAPNRGAIEVPIEVPAE